MTNILMSIAKNVILSDIDTASDIYAKALTLSDKLSEFDGIDLKISISPVFYQSYQNRFI